MSDAKTKEAVTRLVVEAEQNRRNLDIIIPMVRYRQERIQELGRRAAIEVVFCVLDEEIRRAKTLRKEP
jgi:hypothetical protein